MGVSLSRFPKGPRGGTPAGQGLNVGPCRAQADGVTVIAGGWGCGGGRHRRLVPPGPRPGLTELPFSLGSLDMGPQNLPSVRTVVTVRRLFLCARRCVPRAPGSPSPFVVAVQPLAFSG